MSLDSQENVTLLNKTVLFFNWIWTFSRSFAIARGHPCFERPGHFFLLRTRLSQLDLWPSLQWIENVFFIIDFDSVTVIRLQFNVSHAKATIPQASSIKSLLCLATSPVIPRTGNIESSVVGYLNKYWMSNSISDIPSFNQQ